MSTAIKQVVTVQPGGVVEVRSSELHAGQRAEVTVVVVPSSSEAPVPASNGSGWRRFAGSISYDGPHGNEQIDADLAKEYGRGLDSET